MFIIPACIDTVVELGLVESPEGQTGRSGVGRYFIFYTEIIVYYCLSDLGLDFGCLPQVVVCVYWVRYLIEVLINVHVKLCGPRDTRYILNSPSVHGYMIYKKMFIDFCHKNRPSESS